MSGPRTNFSLRDKRLEAINRRRCDVTYMIIISFGIIYFIIGLFFLSILTTRKGPIVILIFHFNLIFLRSVEDVFSQRI